MLRVLSCVAFAGWLLWSHQATAAEDFREAVKLPPEVKAQFMAEMRGHMGNLDDIVAALTEGDFGEAARIAEIHMDFGHSLWEAMADQGATDEEIAAMKERFRAMGRGPGQGQGAGARHGGGGGMGRFMPEPFREIGMEFHAAAGRFAEAAREAEANPTADSYPMLLGNLQEITATCRGCHAAFKIE